MWNVDLGRGLYQIHAQCKGQFARGIRSRRKRANQPEPPSITALYKQLPDLYPSLTVDIVSGDAAFGTDLILHTVYYDLHAQRVIDLRAHETDKDPLNRIIRDYDD